MARRETDLREGRQVAGNHLESTSISSCAEHLGGIILQGNHCESLVFRSVYRGDDKLPLLIDGIEVAHMAARELLP